MQVSASFLGSKNIPSFLEELNETTVNYIHVDVMDGKYVKNKTMPFREMKKIRNFTSKRLDVHLMVKDPKKWIKDFALLNTAFITIHLDINENVKDMLQLIKKYGIKSGIAVTSDISVNDILPYLDEIDLILVMGVDPGESAQEYHSSTTNKVKELKKTLKKLEKNILISVDGGINETIAKELKDADILVSASYIIKSEDKEKTIKSLRGE